jgi:hypothetical protein
VRCPLDADVDARGGTQLVDRVDHGTEAVRVLTEVSGGPVESGKCKPT